MNPSQKLTVVDNASSHKMRDESKKTSQKLILMADNYSFNKKLRCKRILVKNY